MYSRAHANWLAAPLCEELTTHISVSIAKIFWEGVHRLSRAFNASGNYFRSSILLLESLLSEAAPTLLEAEAHLIGALSLQPFIRATAAWARALLLRRSLTARL